MSNILVRECHAETGDPGAAFTYWTFSPSSSLQGPEGLSSHS